MAVPASSRAAINSVRWVRVARNSSRIQAATVSRDADGRRVRARLRCRVRRRVERFERVAGSVFLGLFGVGLYDQTMLPAV
ncbi:hypothetical protein J2W56_001887 [Nocardia kruczakiae]|uniref:Uncharacterized protein n=1 Tax=Nocardia kruczakiae TaxID=261477 RepID=A0ABU1XC93_9NOCA|nr:hypothetical protein [Nocardia kruczakiae]